MAKREITGILWPKLNANGKFSTTETAKEIWAKSAAGADDQELSNKILAEKNWRYKYNKYVIDHVSACLQSPEAAYGAAEAGLNAVHEAFNFKRDGNVTGLIEAMDTIEGTFETGVIEGTKERQKKLVIPYKNKKLVNPHIEKQVNQWCKYGTIEKCCGTAIKQVSQNAEWVDLSDKYFVLFGASSAMGPFLKLMELGANVIAIDINRKPTWEHLLETAKKSSGKLYFPLSKSQDELSEAELSSNAGCDLLSQTPEICNWLTELLPDQEITVGCYVYLDSEAHVRLAAACDIITDRLIKNRQAKVNLAYLCTPTDVHVIHEDAYDAALTNYKSMNLHNLAVLPIRTLFGSKYLVKNAVKPVGSKDGKTYHLVDGLVIAQGPNYALAKRMQHWRAILGRREGCIVSSNVAPSTATKSVVHNKQFAWAYDGMPFFKPIEIFEQDTSNAVMCALLINDINNPNSVSNPNNDEIKLSNPFELFKYNAFHGGVSRCAYKIGSIGEVSVLIHFIKVLKPVILIIFVLFVVFLIWKLFL